MHPKIRNLLLKIWPILIILVVNLIILIQNYAPNTQLLGWDNLIPEFNLSANIQRSVFAVWQEYQGLGLLGGMGHATDILHQLVLLFFSFIIPLQLLRYFWIFLMLTIGSIGAYLLIKELILKQLDFSEQKKQILSLTGGVFYLLNLSTIQTFYAPFEAFIAHFAALPWLLLSSLLFFIRPNRKNGLFFIIVLILATPQAYLPTLFVVYIISFLILISSLAVIDKSSFSWKSFLMTFSSIFIVNAFWLLPFLYFTITNSQVALDAKINQMSTQTVFLQNKAFGNLQDVILLKGFWFNNVDPNLQGIFTYMLNPWRDYLANPVIQIIGFMLFGIVIAGIIGIFKKSKGILIPFFVLFLFSITMLSTNTPPFSWLDMLFRKIPLFDEAFRFPFTKFSIVASLTYSIFLTLGIAKLFSLNLIKKINLYVWNIIVITLIIIFTFPIFQGQLFYSKEKLNLPKDYTQAFQFFKSQNPNTRIANLPQPTFWGWEFYNWGYGGSGFLWYGIKQPILDRAFDVWSKNDENYYWELSQAIYSKNPVLLETVLNKYQINWLLFDKNLIYPSSPTSLFTTETESLIKQIPSIQKTVSFGKIDVYRVNLRDNPKNFVFSAKSLSFVDSYSWNNFDRPYTDLGNYASSGNQGFFYPFRSLFSNKNQKDKAYKMTDGDNEITLQNPLPEHNSPITINLPSFWQTEQIIATTLSVGKNKDGSLSLNALVKTPEISILNKTGLNKTVLYSKVLQFPLADIPKNQINTLTINVNGIKNYNVNPTDGNKEIGATFFLTHQNNVIVVNGPGFPSKTVNITPQMLSIGLNANLQSIPLPGISKDSFMQIKIPKVNDGYESFEQSIHDDTAKTVSNCDNFNKNQISSFVKTTGNEKLLQLESRQSTACLYYYAPNLLHDQGYAIFVQNANNTGRGLHFWLLNEDEKYSPIDTYLDSNKEINQASFIIAPQESFGRAYSLHFDNISIANEPTVNLLGKVSMYPLPYNFINSLNFSYGSTNEVFNDLNITNVIHPNEAEYVIRNVSPKTPASLILSQSFDNGWVAYTLKPSDSRIVNIFNVLFPEFFGTKIKNHVLVNNWENGWILDNPQNQKLDIIIIYIPQYLEFFGFSLIFISPLFMFVFLKLKFEKKSPLV